MINFLKTLIKTNLKNRNRYITKLTKKEQLEVLIKKLHPLKTDKPLIRFGPTGDGGYLIPDDLEGVNFCFSPGVDKECGFEEDCANRGIQVFMADGSVNKPPNNNPFFHFDHFFIGITNNEQFRTINDWIHSSGVGEDDEILLQMDIEGYEYEVFASIEDILMEKIRIIVCEFHFLDELWNKPFFNIASRIFEKILKTHSCVHIHPNNFRQEVHFDGITLPSIMEFTFLRKDRIANFIYANEFPHPLDSDNTIKHSLKLPPCWYSQ